MAKVAHAISSGSFEYNPVFLHRLIRALDVFCDEDERRLRLLPLFHHRARVDHQRRLRALRCDFDTFSVQSTDRTKTSRNGSSATGVNPFSKQSYNIASPHTATQTAEPPHHYKSAAPSEKTPETPTKTSAHQTASPCRPRTIPYSTYAVGSSRPSIE